MNCIIVQVHTAQSIHCQECMGSKLLAFLKLPLHVMMIDIIIAIKQTFAFINSLHVIHEIQLI